MPKSSSRSRLRTPDLGAEFEVLREYRDKAFGIHNTLRNRKLEQIAQSFLYVYGKQWIELDTAVLVNGSRGFTFRNMHKGAGPEIPRPVTNKCAGAVNVEVSSLGRRELTANVLTFSRDPRVEAAAKVAKDILENRLDILHWPDLRELATYINVIAGVVIVKSYWDEVWTDVGYYNNPEAVGCVGCDTKLASATVPKDKAQEMGSRFLEQATLVDEDNLSLNFCPTCETPTPMGPAMLDPTDEQDLYGRFLSKVEPKGGTAIEVVSPFDWYPENCGIDVDWRTTRLHRQATPRSLDWIFERWPELEGRVEPEDSRELMKNHPVLGDWDILGRYDSELDADLYANHAMVYEVYEQKSYRFPKGRAIVMVADEAPIDGELLQRRGDGPEVPIVCYSGANWEMKHRDLWGKGIIVDLISPQNRVNGMDAQTIVARERMGDPHTLTPQSCYLEGPEYDSQGGGKIMTYRIDPINPAAKPEVWGGTTIPQGVVEERAQCMADMQEIQGPAAIEIGEAPKNITTTSGLQLLGENAERRRGYRERALISCFERIWEHQLDLLWAFRVDEDNYEAKADDGTWEVLQYNREILMGPAKIKIEKQAEVDKSLYQREAVREAMADQLYGDITLLSTQARQRILELRGLPTDINEDANYQITQAKKQWVDFVDNGAIPVIDPSIDDFTIHYQSLATFLLSPEGSRVSKAAGWPSVLKKIYGWELWLQNAELADAQARALYGTDNPQQAQEMYAQLMVQFAQQQEQYQATTAAAEQAAAGGMPPGAAIPPPQQPIPPVFLPGDKADHIYGIWKKVLMDKGQEPPPPDLSNPMGADPNEGIQRQDNFLKFQAVVEAYRLLAAEKASGIPGVGAPGTPAGNPAINGQPGAPGASQLANGLAGSAPDPGQLNVAPAGG